ncbi:helix-turn-helix transcriptional regulator [Thermomonospora cellulosilytica]|uniref:Transcriptional regulator with XRE-family HTH domain n=1 Tax=Thermomonospora cellulosilytica TaxID=1411118 RepID=A0A7W3R7V1_9ACTN|nr:helix-turn-helix transcriptional regulator [Thermomonospora cellulosilytica]MBA9002730.1 transcriptional regulator with XRE-family HTH domain [Thermomonospora cellulosilytica]
MTVTPLPGGARTRRRRPELASFLRSRRERITPEEVGMPPGGPRRRTPGLRREEVAQLAGVGVTWYTWLEQGRPINVSAQVLDAVARTLRLDAAEREHLYRLADVPPPPAADDEARTVPRDMRTILDGLDPLPATLVNARSDVLGWNETYAALFPTVVDAPDGERNTLWFAYTTPPCCNPILNLQEQAPEHVAVFRYRYSRHLNEPGWRELVQRLCAASPEFARLWATHDVAPPRPCDKIFHYPAVGTVATRTTSLDVTALPGTRLVVYTPVDDESRDRIAWLRAHPEAAAPPHRH